MHNSAKQLRALGSYDQPAEPHLAGGVDGMLSPTYLTTSLPHTAGMKYLSIPL